MATIKAIIDSASVSAFASSAEAKVVYYVDMGTDGSLNPSVLVQALATVPQIGSQRDFPDVPGAPAPKILPFGGANGTAPFQMNQMRVAERHVMPTKNSKKIMIQLVYRSRPRPVLEYDSSLTQRVVETYLAEGNNTSVGNQTRKQMTLDYLFKANSYSPGNPQEDFTFPKVPASSSVLQFGASVGASATYYTDEIDLAQMKAIRENYSNRVNGGLFLFSKDSQKWLCSTISISSPDGGYSYRIGAQLVYNPDGWNSIEVFTYPFNKTKAILSDGVIAKLFSQPDFVEAGTVSPSYNPAGAGAGRFTQHAAADLGALINALSNGNKLPSPVF